jgi:AcrR family transcriptional regulator
VGQRQQLVESIVFQPQNPQHLLLGEALAALQHLFASPFQNVFHVHLRFIERCSGYGSGVQLHKADVVDAATALLDTYGIADLTMRRLARELDVSPGALYWHFPNKQALLGAVADRILQTVDDVPGSWRDRVAGVCALLRDALLSHTDGAELVSASFAAGQSAAMAHIVADLADAAAEAGVASEQAELAARTVVYYVLGFTADEQSRLQWDASGAVLADGQSVLTTDATGRFAFGLRLLVDGMAHARTQLSPK